MRTGNPNIFASRQLVVGTGNAHVTVLILETDNHATVFGTYAAILNQDTDKWTLTANNHTLQLHDISISLSIHANFRIHALPETLDALVVAHNLYHVMRKQHGTASWYVQPTMVADYGCNVYPVATAYVKLRQCAASPHTALGKL